MRARGSDDRLAGHEILVGEPCHRGTAADDNEVGHIHENGRSAAVGDLNESCEDSTGQRHGSRTEEDLHDGERPRDIHVRRNLEVQDDANDDRGKQGHEFEEASITKAEIADGVTGDVVAAYVCLLYTSPSPRD